ncbi:1-phosphofructokinase family hexose kinase [Microbacterium sp. USHLN186]|uniref:1-phosphofructokinase family hexose kinase n=1 Tax=Microbacterium sp. USHLN186 TaxID=3081286 RepID=UPI003018F1F0
MIITVTPNPALDLTWHVDALVVGGTHRADAGRARAGGKGLNVARVAHAEGARVRAVTTAGGTTGAEFGEELTTSGVPHALVSVAGATRRSIALVDEALGDTTIVNERGVAPTDAEWQALHAAVARELGVTGGVAGWPSGADTPDVGPFTASGPTSGVSATGSSPVAQSRAGVLVISGSLPPHTPAYVLPSLIALGRAAGVEVIVDTSGPALLAAADAGAAVLKPNEHELRDATGLDDPIDGARELIRRGARLVLLSLGVDGMLAVSPADPAPADPVSVDQASGASAAAPAVEVLHARLDESLRGNPTGAGDAGVAACAVLLDAGIRDPEQILRRATAWSAAAVLMPLAGEIHPSWPDLERALTVTRLPSATLETPVPARDVRSDVPSPAATQVSPPTHPKEPR